MEPKTCRICKDSKAAIEFVKNKRSNDGRQSACKSCLTKQRLALVDVDQSGGYVKRCTQCNLLRPFDEFVRNRYTKDGRHYTCKECAYPKRAEYETTARDKLRAYQRRRYWSDPERARDYHATQKYGIKRGQYAEMLAAQAGKCAICGRGDNPGKTRFAIDHCHETATIRGLLCTCCNQAIGQLKHSPELIRRAADYLERTSPLTKAACP